VPAAHLQRRRLRRSKRSGLAATVVGAPVTLTTVFTTGYSAQAAPALAARHLYDHLQPPHG
jgi:hypothetical protein